MRVRRVVKAGSSVEVSRRGTSERTGYTVVEEAWGVDGNLGGELAGVKRCERCFEADFLKDLGDSRGDTAAFEDGQLMVYPAGSGEG
jgi:hypothetical protein